MTPAMATLHRKASKLPNRAMESNAMEVSPAAGPLTLVWEPLIYPTTKPPTTPAMTPDKSGAPEAKAIPKHKGKVTRNTTIAERKSVLKKFFIIEIILRLKTRKQNNRWRDYFCALITTHSN